MKSKIYNLIILDESGSMNCVFGSTHIVMSNMAEEACASPEGREQYYSNMRETSADYFDEDNGVKDY